MNEQLKQTNVVLQDILNRLIRVESRLTRFGEEMGLDMRLRFSGKPNNPRTHPMVVETPEPPQGELIDVVDSLLAKATSIETLLCSAMNLHGVSPQHQPRQMNALRHYNRIYQD